MDTENNQQFSEDELNKDSAIELSDDELALLDDTTREKVANLRKEPFIKKHFREKYQATTKEFEEYKKKNPEVKPDDKKPDKKEAEDLADRRLTAIELRQVNSSLDDEDINKLMAIAKAEGKTAREVLNDEYFQLYLTKKKEKKEATDSIPGSSSRMGQGTNSKFEAAEKDTTLIQSFDEKTLSEFVKWQAGRK